MDAWLHARSRMEDAAARTEPASSVRASQQALRHGAIDAHRRRHRRGIGGGQLGGRSRGERQVRCRLPFRSVKSSQVSLSSPVPSGRGALRAAVRDRTVSLFSQNGQNRTARQSHHSLASRLCAQTGRSPPSGRAGEPASREGRPTRGRRRSKTPREEYYLKKRRETRESESAERVTWSWRVIMREKE
jgi:hypothetical protein